MFQISERFINGSVELLHFEVVLLKYLSFIGPRADIYATSSRHFNFCFNFRHQRGYINKLNVGQIVKTQTKTGGESEVNKMANAVEENCGFKKGKLCLENFWPIRARGRGSKLIGPMPIKNSKIFCQ